MKHKKTLSSTELQEINRMSLMGYPMHLMGSFLGISKDTLERMIKTNAALRAAINHGKSAAETIFRILLYKMAMTEGRHMAKAMILYAKMYEFNLMEPARRLQSIKCPMGQDDEEAGFIPHPEVKAQIEYAISVGLKFIKELEEKEYNEEKQIKLELPKIPSVEKALRYEFNKLNLSSDDF